MWKRNNSVLIFLCFIPMLRLQASIGFYSEDSVLYYSDESVAASELLDTGGQDVFEKEPLFGKKADKKAMEDRVKDVSYAEKIDEPEPTGKVESNKPMLEVPKKIDQFKDLIFWIAVVILLGIIVYLILKTGKRKRFINNNNLAGPREWQEAWQIDPGALEEDLQDAVESGNYRLAIRLLYLKNLRQLIEKEFVRPSPEKTNLQYRTELEKAGLAELFGLNTRVYETVWYGEAIPDMQQYRRLSPSFHDLFERSRK